MMPHHPSGKWTIASTIAHLYSIFSDDGLKSRHVRRQPSQGGKDEPETKEAFAATEHDQRTRKDKCHKGGEKLGATSPQKTQHVGEACTALATDIAGEFWLDEEVTHAQMVDMEPDLTWSHLEDLVA